MRRTTLILLIALILVIGGSGVYVWLNQDTLVLPWSASTNTAQTSTALPTNTVTNTAPITATLPREVKGDTEVGGVLKIGDVQVTLNSQQKLASADGVTADQGQTFLLVYFDGIESANIGAVDQGIRDVKLFDGKTTYPLLALKVASTYIKGDRGYLRFAVPEKAKNLVLQLGTGASVQTVKLP